MDWWAEPALHFQGRESVGQTAPAPVIWGQEGVGKPQNHLDNSREISYKKFCSGHSSVGRVQASQAWCRGFESRCPLQFRRLLKPPVDPLPLLRGPAVDFGAKSRPASAGGDWRELWGRPEIVQKSWIFPEVGRGPLFFIVLWADNTQVFRLKASFTGGGATSTLIL
jgi:hypothetical protein